MKPYTKLYLKAFNFVAGDFIPCELCNSEAKDIHHINCRGMGGSKTKDNIENLMALCRKCHELYGDKKQYKEMLNMFHKSYIYKNSK